MFLLLCILPWMFNSYGMDLSVKVRMEKASPLANPKSGGEIEPPAVLKDIVAIMEQQQEAWNHGDLDRFVSSYDDKAEFVSGTRAIIGRDAILAYYKNHYSPDKMGKLKFHHLKLLFYCDRRALITGIWELDSESNPKSGWFTLLWKHSSGSDWRILYDHSS